VRQVFSTARGIEVLDVPSPMVKAGQVLVEVEYSLVSTGTELATLSATKAGGQGLASEVVSNPGLTGKLVGRVRTRGLANAASGVRDHLDARAVQAHRLAAVGYSCSGRVIGVGDGVTTFRKGDRVACAGAGSATHSELVAVSENLVVGIPAGCDMKSAASVAVGSVAMQGVRRADVRLGEHVAVIGLGLVGLVTVQLLRLSGARTIGFDVDPRRAEPARSMGAAEAYHDDAEMMQGVGRLTGHMGVDVTLIAASSESSEPVRTAIEATRQRGRVVVIGLVGMEVQREPFLRKEIDLAGSSSYGPGRYDPGYEDGGLDYPYPYVRWTEGRNMAEYLRLLAEGSVNLSPLAEEYPVEAAGEAYERLAGSDDRPAAFIRYGDGRRLEDKLSARVSVREQRHTGRVGVGVAGAGSFVRRVRLPSLRRMAGGAKLTGVLTSRGSSALEVVRQFDGGYAATAYRELLGDTSTDAVLVGTRHNLHGRMAIEALRAGKHTFVEKPLALTEDDLSEIEGFYETETGEAGPPVLQTGFNRRFSPYMVELKRLARSSGTPLIMNYQMNAGFLPVDHWLRTDEGGGRNLGEACHIYDLFTFLTDARVSAVRTASITPASGDHARNENFTTTLSFEDGSMGTLTYTTLGAKGHPKELLHVYADEAVYVMTDYTKLEATGAKPTKTTKTESKGHDEELRAFVDAVRNGGEWPIPLWQQLQASRVALTVERQIDEGT